MRKIYSIIVFKITEDNVFISDVDAFDLPELNITEQNKTIELIRNVAKEFMNRSKKGDRYSLFYKQKFFHILITDNNGIFRLTDDDYPQVIIFHALQNCLKEISKNNIQNTLTTYQNIALNIQDSSNNLNIKTLDELFNPKNSIESSLNKDSLTSRKKI